MAVRTCGNGVVNSVITPMSKLHNVMHFQIRFAIASFVKRCRTSTQTAESVCPSQDFCNYIRIAFIRLHFTYDDFGQSGSFGETKCASFRIKQ